MASPPEVDKDALLVQAALTILAQEMAIDRLQQQVDEALPVLEMVRLRKLKVRINPQILKKSKSEMRRWRK
jgi:hypothetical protein